MGLRKILTVAALTLGALAVSTAAASATTNSGPGHHCQKDRDDFICHRVITPPILNLTYVRNDNPTVVKVDLFGTYYWVQTKDTLGNVTFLGPDTTTVILTPGESLSVAWHPRTGLHEWVWLGEVCIKVPVVHCLCHLCLPLCDRFVG